MDRFNGLLNKVTKHIEGHIDKYNQGQLNHNKSNRTPAPTDLLRLNPHQKPPPHHNAGHILPSKPPHREVKISHVQELGNVYSTSTKVERDLGFQGKLGDYILLTYGDTMFKDEEGSDRFIGMTCNSAGIACNDPTRVFDPLLGDDNKFPRFLLQPTKEYGEDQSGHALGITNVIEISHGRGILYFLLNHRPDGQSHIDGAGVAEVSIEMDGDRPVPKCKRLCKYWWDGDKEPWYGDICALRAGDHIYAYGHAKDNPWIYLTRVNVQHATDLNAYEYWNGKTWQRERLRLEGLNEEQSVFWKIQQGQIIWSEYHGCFLFVYCDAWWQNTVLIKTASAPEGPWSEAIIIHKAALVQEKGCVYSAVPHPYFDDSGKTLVVTFTNLPGIIQAIRVTFE